MINVAHLSPVVSHIYVISGCIRNHILSTAFDSASTDLSTEHLLVVTLLKILI